MQLLQGTRAQGVSPPPGVCPSGDALRTEIEEVKGRVAYLASQVTSFLEKQFWEQKWGKELDMRCSQLWFRTDGNTTHFPVYTSVGEMGGRAGGELLRACRELEGGWRWVIEVCREVESGNLDEAEKG